MNRVEAELTKEFKCRLRHKSIDSKIVENETKQLKKLLNQLVCENNVKSEKLEKVKMLVKAQKGKLTNSVCKLRISELNTELGRLENEVKMKNSEKEVMGYMKDQEVYNLMSLKENIRKLKKIHKNEMVEARKNEERNGWKKVWNEFDNAATMQDLRTAKEQIAKDQARRQKRIDRLTTTKTRQEQAIKKSLQTLSEANLKERVFYKQENNAKKQEFLEIVQNTLSDTSQNFFFRENSEKTLTIIRQALKTIKKNINDCPDFQEPLNTHDIAFIISSYSKLKFQEQSLSINFQSLTEEQMEKQQKCDKIRTELNLIKKNEPQNCSQVSHPLTYNQLKSALANQEIHKNNEDFTTVQKMIIQLYLQTCNFSLKLKKIVENVQIQVKSLGRDEELIKCLMRIENFNQVQNSKGIKDVFCKKKSATVIDRRKNFMDFNRVYKQTISEQKIRELLIRNQGLLGKTKKCEGLGIEDITELIKADTIACFFIEVQGLDSKIIGFFSSPKAVVTELNRLACQNFKILFKELTEALLQALELIKARINSGKDDIFKFYSEKDPKSVQENGKIVYKSGLAYLEGFKRSPKKEEEGKEEEAGLNSLPDNFFMDKSTKTGLFGFQSAKLPKANKKNLKISTFGFGANSNSNKILRTNDYERLSLRCSPTFLSGNLSSLTLPRHL